MEPGRMTLKATIHTDTPDLDAMRRKSCDDMIALFDAADEQELKSVEPVQIAEFEC